MKHIVLISGGKDSTATLFRVIEKIGKENVIGLFNDTEWEHPDTYKYINELEKFSKVKIYKTKPVKSVREIITNEILSVRTRRCSKEAKVKPTRIFIRQFKPEPIILYIGIRKDESKARALRYKNFNEDTIVESSTYSIKSQKVYENYPIVNFAEKEVFNYIKSKGFYPNPLYSKGFKRVGCYPCIFSRVKEIELTKKDKIGKERIELLKTELTKKFTKEELFRMSYNYRYLFR